jgi:type II secretory pathway pseudopilin PulG
MKITIAVMAVLAALIVPTAFATTPAQAPSAFCKANAALIGAGKTYATMGDCVSKQAALAAANRTNAAKACKAEMADAAFAASHGNKTFDQFYGTSAGNGKGKGNGNAFGTCVSQKAGAKTADQQSAQVNAARKCRTPDLKAQIGSGKTYRNFGACVAAQGKAAS